MCKIGWLGELCWKLLVDLYFRKYGNLLQLWRLINRRAINSILLPNIVRPSQPPRLTKIPVHIWKMFLMLILERLRVDNEQSEVLFCSHIIRKRQTWSLLTKRLTQSKNNIADTSWVLRMAQKCRSYKTENIMFDVKRPKNLLCYTVFAVSAYPVKIKWTKRLVFIIVYNNTELTLEKVLCLVILDVYKRQGERRSSTYYGS